MSLSRIDAFRGFKQYSSFHGPEKALKIITNERIVLEKVEEFVKKHDVQCDLNVTNTFDVCMTPAFATYEAEAFEGFQKAGDDFSHVKFYSGDEASARWHSEGDRCVRMACWFEPPCKISTVVIDCFD